MFFRHGIEKVAFSRDSLENISFEPSRHPSTLDGLPYRESFFDRIPNWLFWVECFLYMIGTYNDDETVDSMAMAWGGICAENMVALNLEEDHRTVANLKARGAFTLSVPGIDTLVESDFMGIASANKFHDKFSRTGLHAVKSTRVDAPVITEYPLTLECKVVEMQEQPYGLRVLGEIVNVMADERVLDESGKIDCGKLNTFLFDQMRHDYYAVGDICGKAWHSGAPLVKAGR